MGGAAADVHSQRPTPQGSPINRDTEHSQPPARRTTFGSSRRRNDVRLEFISAVAAIESVSVQRICAPIHISSVWRTTCLDALHEMTSGHCIHLGITIGSHEEDQMRRPILRNALTAAARDLHHTCPNEFVTDVRTLQAYRETGPASLSLRTFGGLPAPPIHPDYWCASLLGNHAPF
jgi:hypothetical protein